MQERLTIMGAHLGVAILPFALVLAAACAQQAPPPAVATPAVLVGQGSPEQRPEPEGPAEPTRRAARDDTGGVRLTGGVGNKVVGSFDQLRDAVRAVQPQVDECYRSTASEGGWRENLMWDLDVSAEGAVTRVTLHDAEYWRGGRVVPATPSPGLARCMERTLLRLVVPPPVRAGWVRLRFEP